MTHKRSNKKEELPEKGIVILGDSGAGKTSLLRALNGEQFGLFEHTHGLNRFKINNQGAIIDFPGEISPETIASQLNETNIVAGIIVIDSRNDVIKEQIEHWNECLNSLHNSEEIEKFLVMSRCDINTLRPLDPEYSKLGFNTIINTSAKEGIGIQELRSSIHKTVGINFLDDTEKEGEEYSSIAIIVRVMVDKMIALIVENSNILKLIEWRDLERIISTALEEIGFSIILTPPSKDGGKDIIANCIVENQNKTYFIEIKHWTAGTKVGEDYITKFIEVNVKENTDGGLFISSAGFVNPVYSHLSRFIKQKVRLGDKNKIVSLCQHYIRKKRGLWHLKSPLPEILFEETLIPKF